MRGVSNDSNGVSVFRVAPVYDLALSKPRLVSHSRRDWGHLVQPV